MKTPISSKVAMELGAAKFLVKPVNVEQLGKELAELLSARHLTITSSFSAPLQKADAVLRPSARNTNFRRMKN
jgi:YesN/AraC family two-component response regulator